MDTNISAARSSRSLPNDSNPYQIRDDEDGRLTFYKSRLEEEILSIHQFLNNYICNSSSPPVSKTYPKRQRQQTDFFYEKYPSNTNKNLLLNYLKILK